MNAHTRYLFPVSASRSLRFLIGCLLVISTALTAWAEPVIGTATTSFTAAEAGRSYMTVGGVWKGTADVTNTTGDTFSVTYTNTGDATAFNIAPRIVLPTGFTRVGAMSVSSSSGSPAITGTPGTTGTIDVDLGGFDLLAGATLTLTYGAKTESTVVSGTYQIAYNRDYALTNLAALEGYGTATQQNVLVQAGDSTINITPKQQERSVGTNANFTVTVTNTGLGGIFDVTINDSSIYPTGNNLQFVSLTQTSPALAAVASNGGSVLTLPYLAPGATFTANIVATVLSCGNIVNNVTSTHRVAVTSVTDSAPVQLDLKQPLVAYTPPPVTLDYNVPVTVSIPIQNTGLGAAYNFKLQSNLQTRPLTVSNVAAGWTYNATTGLFTYTANSGTIANAGSATLSFSLLATDPCNANGAGTVSYTALYKNGCGDDYTIPIQSQAITAATNTPTLTLNKVASANRIAVLESGSYTLTLSATNLTNISTTNVTVTDVLPSQIDYLGHSASLGTATYTAGTRTLTWTVPVANLNAARTLTINFAVANDPCNAGQQITNTANTSSLTTTRGCTLNATSAASFLITNNPGVSASQFFNVSGAPTGGIYETGNADAAPLGLRDTGEGEFIPFEAGYTFGPAYPGTWAGSTYTDLFGGVTQMVLSSGSLTVTGSFGTIAVPPAFITTLSPGFRVDLGFLAGATFFNNANVAGKTITFNYRTTAPDAAVPGITRAVTHLTTFVLATSGGGGSGGCNTPTQSTFTQGAFYTLGRAQAQIGLSLPGVLEVCKDELLTLTVSNANAKEARNILVTLLNSGTDYVYDTTYTPVYGGAFTAGTITYAANAGTNPTFTYTGNPLTADGTIQVRIHRKSNGDTVARALTARVNYDSWQTAAAVGRVYNSTGAYTPSSVRKAHLAITVTPGSLTVTSTKISYLIYVSNTDAGRAYGSVLTDTLPVGITVNIADTNAANPGYPVSTGSGAGGRQVLTWALGDIASGTTIPITVKADVGVIPGCSISINPSIDTISASWGCDANIFSTVTKSSPSFVFPAGKMQVVHDSTQTVARLCDPGKVVVVVKNTGPTNIQGVVVSDVIPPSAGFSIAGNVRYRVNGGALQVAASAPTGTGASGNPYVWTSAQIPELSELVPVGVTGANQITIEIDLAATEALAGQNPVLSASATATVSCGNAVSSPAQPFSIRVELPKVSIAKTGRNITANAAAPFGEDIYGGAGDILEWKLVITNTGNATANNLRLSDALSGSSGTAVINGPGLAANTPYTPGLVLSLSSLSANASATYTITEVLGSNCVSTLVNANISWGCINNGAAVHSNVTTPGTPFDPAKIVMLPNITAGTQLTQSITHLPGGRALITVNVTNNGGTAHAPVITATIPTGSTFDSTGAVTFGGPVADITTVTRTGGTDSKPEFTFIGAAAPHKLRYGETMSVSYYVRPTVFDTTAATTFPLLATFETTDNGLDPSPPAAANITAKLDYTTSCGTAQSSTNNISYDPRTPDLDINLTYPGDVLLSNTSAANYVFTVVNNGDADSVADFIHLDLPNLGSGWTVNSITLTTAGTGGNNGATIAPGGAFTPLQVGTLAKNQTAVVTVNAQYSGTPGPLTLVLRARGEARSQDGTVNGNYSLDQAGRRVVGVILSKTLQSTSEPDTTGTNVLVGEEATFRIRADFFGTEGNITNLLIRDTPTNNNGGADRLAYVSHTYTTPTNKIVPDSVTAPAPATSSANVAASRVDFNRVTLTAADVNAGTNTFEADVVFRVLNTTENTENLNLPNNFGVSFTYLGQTFASNSTRDGLSGTTTSPDLHKDTSITVRRPELTIVKTARNVTRAGTFAATAPGQAGDVIEYRLVVSNPASNTPADQRPIYDLTVTDTVPAKFNLSAADQGADTNGSNASIEVANTGGASGLGATITFNQTNTAIGTLGSNFDRLNPGKSITLLFRGALAATVVPNEILNNTGTVRGYSLSVDGTLQGENQTAPKGVENTPTGPTRYEATSGVAALTIDSIVQNKSVITTSEPGSTSPAVFIGEQLRYRITLNLPQGTVPALSATDTLPAGLALVGTPTVSIGADIAADNEPPLYATSNGGQTLTWTFGQAVTSGAGNTITIEYVAQVRNVAANVAGTTLTNDAKYNFTGLPGDVVNLAQHTVTVATPNVTVTHGVRNATRNPGGPYVASIAAIDAIAPDAGDLIEYQISITNTSGTNVASAYDFNIVDTMPAGVTYVGGWAGFDSISGVTPASFATFEPDVTGQVLTWGRTQSAPVNIDIAPGGKMVFHYRVLVSDTSQPLQNYTNAVVIDWTSLDGAPGANLGDAVLAPGNALGERIGTGGGANNYAATDNSPVVARNATIVTKTKSGDTLPRTAADALGASPSGFRIGDIITYTLKLPVQEGTLDAFTIADVMPAGLAFIDTVSITPATGDDGFTYTTPSGANAPAAAATGTVTWKFGTVVNAGDNDTANDEIIVVYRARVLDPAGLTVTPVDQNQNNSATVAFTLADASTHTSVASVASLTVRQPRLTLGKAIVSPALDALGNYVRRPGDTVNYQLTVTNTGTAPAYNIKLTDTLPAGLRVTGPTLITATRNAVNVLATQTAPLWNNGDGTYVWDLADGELLLPGQTLVLTYTATVDNDDAIKGTTLTNSASIDQFFSLPSGDTEAAARRTYAAVGPATTDLVIGLRIDGFVYHDIDVSNARDGAEDWSGLKPTVFANLIADNAGTDIVFRTVTVAPGTGAFAFDYLPPGDFDIILTDAAGNTVAQRPANWLNQTPATGLIAATISNATGDLVDQNLGLKDDVYSPVLAPTISKTASGESIPAVGPQTAFRIGDLVTYTIDVFPHEGTNTTFKITDKLPLGLAYFDTVSIAQVAGAPRFNYTVPSGANAPAAAAEGTLTWNFGTFTNAIADPANNTLRITYRARVIHTGDDPLAVPAVAPATTTDGPLTNSAEISYGNAAVSLNPLTAGPATADITVEQPRLTIGKALSTPALNRIAPGGTGTFTVTVTNNGTAPAYNIRVTDTLPVGLRDTAPTLTAATLNGVDVLAGVTPTWTGAAGTYVFNLSNTQILLPGETLVLAYQFTIDLTAVRAATLTNSAVVDLYYSKPANDATQRRLYAATVPATADVIVGLRIAGTVYEDEDLSDTLSGTESWTGATKPTVYVNLIDSLGAVYRTATIAPGAGTFNFTNLPEDDYTLIVATTDTATVSDRPANWLYRAPNNGTYDLTATSDDVLAQNFGFYQDVLAAAGITKGQSGGTLPLSLPASGYRIGDLVTYTLDLAPQEGSLTNFTVTDELPAGLAFVETVSITQPTGVPRYTYTAPTGVNTPAAAATGTLTWSFGNFANALNGPTDNLLRITYTARVIHSGTNPLAVPSASPATTTSTLVNSAQLAYNDQASNPIAAGPATTSIDVEQPRLTIAKARLAPVNDNIVMPGATAKFRLTVTNNGSGPAYNTLIEDTLPVGLRNATPSLNAATLNGANVIGSLAAPVYSSGTGVWTVSLDDTQILLPAGQTLVLDYTVTVDAGATKGSVLTNSALISGYASKASADVTERRVYAATAPVTQDLIVGVQIDGSVYHQIIPNGTKDGSEDWSTGTPVVVNLVTNSAVSYGSFSLGANQVLRSVSVPVGNGEFSFTNVPAGDYRIIVTNTSANTSPVVPATWTFDTPSTGSLTPVTVTNANLTGQDLGLYQGRVISGRVYNDAAPYGSRQAEDWSGGVTVVVNLVNTYGVPVVHESITVPAGVGTYEFTNVAPGSYQVIVARAGQAAATTAATPTGWHFTDPTTGTLGTFALTTSDITGQEFGLALGRTVSGYVYNDTTPNGTKDGFEDWTTGTPVVVNLVRTSDNVIYASANVPIGAGGYSFSDVAPGDYRIIVTNGAAQNTAVAPTSWLFRAPATGSQNITVAAADLTDRNFGLFRGRTLVGRVFRDNGSGGGTANNGTQNGAEPGIGNVTVRLLSAGLAVLDITQTNGAGDFVLRIPAETVPGATLIVEETNPPQHISTGADVGDSAGTYNRTTDRITFSYGDADVTGIRFGDVPASSLLTDGAQTILPGSTAFYQHTFRAGTAGTVIFTTTGTATPVLPWTQVLVRDLNCNGAIDAGEPIINGVPIVVAADEEICLVLKDSSPPNTGYGAKQSTTITAVFTYANNPLNETMSREDVTTIGPTTSSGLTLVKKVDKTLAQPGEIITYTVTYTNAGSEPLTDLFIDDRTPAYTVLAAASTYTLPLPDDLTAGTITEPAVGAAGSIRWTFGGVLNPGATGSVIFQVKVQN